MMIEDLLFRKDYRVPTVRTSTESVGDDEAVSITLDSEKESVEEKTPDSSTNQQPTDAPKKLAEIASTSKQSEGQSSSIDSHLCKIQVAPPVHTSNASVEGDEAVTKTTTRERKTADEDGARSSKIHTTRKDSDVSMITKDGEVIVSKTTRREIGSDGGAISVGDCLVTFPKDSLQTKTEIVAKAEINRAKWPRGYFLITPMLYVDGGGNLSEPASVRMISWCINNKSKENENATVDLLHCDDDRDEWNPISKLPFTNETVYQFECLNFSPYAIGIQEDAIETQTILLQPLLFSNPQNTLAYTFSVTDKMMLEAIEKDMRKLGFTPSLFFTTPSVKEGDKICVRLQCARPDGFFCDPTETLFEIDSEMAKMHRYIEYFVVNSNKQKATKIQLKSSILKNGVAIANNQPFFYNWKNESEAQPSQESTSGGKLEKPVQRSLQLPPTPQQNVGPVPPINVNVQVGDRVNDNVIGNFAAGQAELSAASYGGENVVASNSNIGKRRSRSSRRNRGNLRHASLKIPQPRSRYSRRFPRPRQVLDDQASNSTFGTYVAENAQATTSQYGSIFNIVASGCNIEQGQNVGSQRSQVVSASGQSTAAGSDNKQYFPMGLAALFALVAILYLFYVQRQ